jgi:hypothetical protein
VLPKLQESAKKFGISPHIVMVGSGVAFHAKGILETIDGDILDGLTQGGQKMMRTRQVFLRTRSILK